MNAEPEITQREQRLQRRRELDRARRQSESAEQREELLRSEEFKTELDMLLRLSNKGSYMYVYNEGVIDLTLSQHK